MLTARDDDTDKIVGLELGADDYMTKPFNPKELVARVRAIFRRVGPQRATGEVIVFGDLRMDLEKREVLVNGHQVHLTPTEFDLLKVMAQHPGRVFSRAQLLDLVAGASFEGYDRAVDSHIKNLRQKIEKDPRKPHYVQTVFGVGYKFVSG
jgi:DNA-binding response OmpR family regulator